MELGTLGGLIRIHFIPWMGHKKGSDTKENTTQSSLTLKKGGRVSDGVSAWVKRVNRCCYKHTPLIRHGARQGDANDEMSEVTPAAKATSLQEVIRSAARHVRFASSWSWIELKAANAKGVMKPLFQTPDTTTINDKHQTGNKFNLQWIFQRVVQFHNGGLVAAPITIVRRAENGHNVPIMTPIVPAKGEVEFNESPSHFSQQRPNCRR